MSDKWTVLPFQDAVDFREGPGIMARDFRSEGVPLVRLAGVKQGADILTGCNYLDPEMVTKKWDHFRLSEGDVILSTSASLGEVAIVPRTGVGAIPYTGLIRMRGKAGVLDQAFLPWVLRAPDFARQVQAMGVGSVMNHFGPSHLRQMTLTVPPLAEQRRIAGVLGALDDLIETNQRLIASLADMRMAAWSLAKSVQTVKFGSIADLCTDRAAPSDLTGDTTYLALEHFAENGGGLTGKGTAQGLDSQKSRFRAGDVLYGKLRPYFRKVARPDFDGICSTEIWVLRPTANVTAEFLESVVSSQAFTDFAMQGSGGTHMPRARWDHVSSFPVAVPTAADLARITGFTEAMWRQMWSLRSENERLGRTRDELLPLLLSGRVSVREVAA